MSKTMEDILIDKISKRYIENLEERFGETLSEYLIECLKEGFKQGYKEGKAEAQLEFIQTMLKMKKYSYQEISDIFHLSVEEIEEIGKNLYA